MCDVLLPPGVNPTAVKYISYILPSCTEPHTSKLKMNQILDKLLEYKRNWIQHVNRMPRNRLPRVMKQCCPTGRRNHGITLKRLLDTWDRNGSTRGPTAWQIYDDDDDDDDVKDGMFWLEKVILRVINKLQFFYEPCLAWWLRRCSWFEWLSRKDIAFPSLFLSWWWPCLPTDCSCTGILLHLIIFSDTYTQARLYGRIPLDEGSDRHRHLYLTTHNTD
jgi:hypothetical protein